MEEVGAMEGVGAAEGAVKEAGGGVVDKGEAAVVPVDKELQ